MELALSMVKRRASELLMGVNDASVEEVVPKMIAESLVVFFKSGRSLLVVKRSEKCRKKRNAYTCVARKHHMLNA
jgi:hypothetical protein